MTRVLLLGAGGNAGCNFVRALRMAGPAFVVGVDIDRWNLLSCNADAKVLLERGEGKLAAVLAACREHRVDVVHAQPDAEVRWLIENAPALRAEGFRVFNHWTPLWGFFADKLACQRVWAERLGLGFRCARLADVMSGREAFTFDGKAWVRAICGAGSRAALPVSTLDQAIAWARYWVDARGMSWDDFMIAEYLPGREYAVQTLWDRGRLVQSQARERLVYFFGGIMPSGQSSTPAVAATVHERDVYDTAYAAIRAISPEPHGIHCVDLRRNAAGVVVPLEVNYGRFFTTTDFFAELCVNGPAAYVAMAMGETPPEQVETVRDRWLWLRGIDRAPVLLREEAA